MSPDNSLRKRVRRGYRSQRRVRELLLRLERSEAQLSLLDIFGRHRGGITLDGSIGMAETVMTKKPRNLHPDTTQRIRRFGQMGQKMENHRPARVPHQLPRLRQITKIPMGSTTHPLHPPNLHNPLHLNPPHRLPSPNPRFQKITLRSWPYPSHDALFSLDFTRQWSFATQRSLQQSRK